MLKDYVLNANQYLKVTKLVKDIEEKRILLPEVCLLLDLRTSVSTFISSNFFSATLSLIFSLLQISFSFGLSIISLWVKRGLGAEVDNTRGLCLFDINA